MKFFKPATEDDFKGYEIQYSHSGYMSDDVKNLIEEGYINKARVKFREESRMGFEEMKSYFEEYQKYAQAKKDFDDGKPVFISY